MNNTVILPSTSVHHHVFFLTCGQHSWLQNGLSEKLCCPLVAGPSVFTALNSNLLCFSFSFFLLVSSIKNVESNVFRRRFCYCVTNETNDLTGATSFYLRRFVVSYKCLNLDSLIWLFLRLYGHSAGCDGKLNKLSARALQVFLHIIR